MFMNARHLRFLAWSSVQKWDARNVPERPEGLATMADARLGSAGFGKRLAVGG
jgi:hypothetical protein